MPTVCPLCAQQNAPDAIVCASCSRDIVVPASLIAERDELTRKCDLVREELIRARDELDALRRRKKNRSV